MTNTMSQFSSYLIHTALENTSEDKWRHFYVISSHKQAQLSH